MAYVRRTDRLIDGIKQKISQMQHKAEEMYASERIEMGTPIHSEMRTAVEAAAWALNPGLRALMPRQWTYTSDQCRVVFYDLHGDKIMASSIETSKEDPLILPCKPSSYFDEMKVYHHHQSPALRHWLTEEDQRKRRRDELRQQYHDAEMQVMAFLMTKTSLNAALKEMPELELYVPQEFMDKYHEPTAPRVNVSVEVAEPVQVDRDQLAALGIAHRIATAAE
jgi:hypothetical protein